jgi:hypothetical protein
METISEVLKNAGVFGSIQPGPNMIRQYIDAVFNLSGGCPGSAQRGLPGREIRIGRE